MKKPNIYLIDANVLLDGCFIPISWSRRAIEAIIQNQERILVAEYTITEAKSVIMRIMPFGSNFDSFFSVLMHFVSKCGIEVFTRDSDISGINIPKDIPKSDSYLWPIAKATKATILTRDADLLLSIRRNDASATLPLEVIRKYSKDHGPIITGWPPSAQSGTIFFYGHDKLWFTRSSFPVCLFSYHDDLILDFFPSESKWHLHGNAIQKDVFVSVDRTDQVADRKVALTWSSRGLYFYDSTRNSPFFDGSVCEMLFSKPPETSWNLSLGRWERRRTNEYILQAIDFIFDDRPLSADLWRKISDLDSIFSIQPFDNDRLRHFLRRIHGVIHY